jgi:hypothetical protein
MSNTRSSSEFLTYDHPRGPPGQKSESEILYARSLALIYSFGVSRSLQIVLDNKPKKIRNDPQSRTLATAHSFDP